MADGNSQQEPAAIMRSLKFVLIALLSSFLVLPGAAADESAPFGLSWGMSIEQLKATGVHLRELQADEDGRKFSTSDLPKMLDDIDEVILSFGTNDRLHRVEAISRDFRYDNDGARLKARYETLSRALTAKYGPGKVTHHVTKPWDQPSDFLMGIRMGSSQYYSDFDSTDIAVHLAITAKRRDIGNYVLIYRNKTIEKRSRQRPGESGVL